MNLIVSGPITDSLRNAVTELAQPKTVVLLNAHVLRLEDMSLSAPTQRSIAALCGSFRVDHAYVESGTRFASMRLLAIDMDSTLITIECIDELADYAGKRNEVAAITDATMSGEISDFTESLKRRVALLKDTPAVALKKVFDNRLRLSAGARELISRARQDGIYTLLVSGGFTYFSNRLKDELKFDESHSNVLEIIDGKLSGRLTGPVFGPSEKAASVQAAIQKLGCTPKESIVIGDGANDIPMMQCVEHSIAYHAKPRVAMAARYAIHFGSLTTTLDILG